MDAVMQDDIWDEGLGLGKRDEEGRRGALRDRGNSVWGSGGGGGGGKGGGLEGGAWKAGKVR